MVMDAPATPGTVNPIGSSPRGVNKKLRSVPRTAPINL